MAADNPWIVLMLPSGGRSWTAVCRLPTREDAWNHVDLLKQTFQTRFDVVHQDSYPNA